MILNSFRCASQHYPAQHNSGFQGHFYVLLYCTHVVMVVWGEGTTDDTQSLIKQVSTTMHHATQAKLEVQGHFFVDVP